ncbi:(2Fe-2S)-binding protein [Kibdelosporangium aridum]|uniref:(2Fe-2S)-binding protein n=1 Tax=Kibdelosporangium aridum TaxID=2030 RepID=UPI000526C541
MADQDNPTRRSVLKATGVAAVGVAVPTQVATASQSAEAEGTVQVSLKINGVTHTQAVEPRVTLLNLLREQLGLTGAKKGCDRGECGACTVLIDGERTKSCLTLAAMRDGAEITTVEGLARGDRLHPVQDAFIRHDAFQCGFCTSGQIMSAVACINEGHTKSDDEIKDWMSGNLCRCGCYPNIVAAVRDAAKDRR